MKTTFLKLLFPVLFLLLFAYDSNAQSLRERRVTNPVSSTLKNTGNVALAIVGTTAKIGYKTTKFTAKAGYKTTKFAAKTIVKPIFLRAAPSVGKFAIKQTGKLAIKTGLKSVPIARKAVVAYVKYKPI